MQLALDSARRTAMSAQEVAEQLGVAERTVRRWIAKGSLPAKKTGRSFEIRLEDVERLLGGPLRRRIATRVEEREKEHETVALQAQLTLLREMYDAAQSELAAAHRRIATLELELAAKSTSDSLAA